VYCKLTKLSKEEQVAKMESLIRELTGTLEPIVVIDFSVVVVELKIARALQTNRSKFILPDEPFAGVGPSCC
jgi:lipopolysaccharide export system ATP-binding protein